MLNSELTIELSIIFLLSLFMMIFLQNKFYLMIKENDFFIKNYKGKAIVNIMGITIIIIMLLTITIILAFNIYLSRINWLIFLFASFMGFVGLIDDILGTTSSKGFKGHLSMLFKGRVTSGGVKALVGASLAFIFSLMAIKNITINILDTLLITMTTNLLNLLDTRPGRSLKFFIFSSIIFLFLNIQTILLIGIGASAAYLPYDLKEKSALGDVGSNFLGFLLGASAAVSLTNLKYKITLVIILIILNLLSEMISFSKLIEKTKILKFIDNLGRID